MQGQCESCHLFPFTQVVGQKLNPEPFSLSHLLKSPLPPSSKGGTKIADMQSWNLQFSCLFGNAMLQLQQHKCKHMTGNCCLFSPGAFSILGIIRSLLRQLLYERLQVVDHILWDFSWFLRLPPCQRELFWHTWQFFQQPVMYFREGCGPFLVHKRFLKKLPFQVNWNTISCTHPSRGKPMFIVIGHYLASRR